MDVAVPSAFRLSDSSPYDDYVRAEWALFAADPVRNLVGRELMSALDVHRVLDIGCGAGQEMRPFVSGRAAFGVGIDLSREAGRAGRELFRHQEPTGRIEFLRAGAEKLPFLSATFDVVICRLALPYTDNRAALGEMARVLRPGGALLLKYHHARYYTSKLKDAIGTRRLKPAIHACRVLAAGSLYHLTGRQHRNRILGAETFQTRALLRRELAPHGLAIERQTPFRPRPLC
jgi:SAM-dependent methyltransferase